MKIKAIFPPLHAGKSRGMLIGHVPPPEGDVTREFEWDAPSEDEAVAIEQAYREFNVVEEGDGHIARECRSMSVGDVVLVNGKYMIVDSCGFKQIPNESFEAWCGLPISDRLMGPTFCLERGIVKI